MVLQDKGNSSTLVGELKQCKMVPDNRIGNGEKLVSQTKDFNNDKHHYIVDDKLT